MTTFCDVGAAMCAALGFLDFATFRQEHIHNCSDILEEIVFSGGYYLNTNCQRILLAVRIPTRRF